MHYVDTEWNDQTWPFIVLVYLAKLSANTIVLCVLQCLLISLFCVLCDLPLLNHPGKLLLIVLLGNLGLAAVGTLLGALAVSIGRAGSTLTLLVMPLVVGDSIIGVIGLGRDSKPFDEEETAVNAALASSAALMLHSHNERTQRFEMVRALRESDEKYRDLVDNLTVGIYRFPLGGGPPLAANKVAA